VKAGSIKGRAGKLRQRSGKSEYEHVHVFGLSRAFQLQPFWRAMRRKVVVNGKEKASKADQGEVG
jgi:hypothetical protein